MFSTHIFSIFLLFPPPSICCCKHRKSASQSSSGNISETTNKGYLFQNNFKINLIHLVLPKHPQAGYTKHGKLLEISKYNVEKITYVTYCIPRNTCVNIKC